MRITNFEYDGIKLSDMGYMICNFDSNGTKTIENGCQINFNTVSTLNGGKNELSNSGYSECLSTTLQICKNPCLNKDNFYITKEDLTNITSWLSRREFHEFKFLDNDYLNAYVEASFNINCIENNGQIIGLELNMITNRPYALQQPVQIMIKNLIENGEKYIFDIGNEEGFIYPDMTININQSGDLSIYNELDNQTMIIKNCTDGEIITIQYPIIQSSIKVHKIQNDFNWNFFRIVNTFKNKTNKIKISLPCSIKINYSPILKIGI